jgi:uncharacterized protein YdhG (YjbR/CyaY superfamily)
MSYRNRYLEPSCIAADICASAGELASLLGIVDRRWQTVLMASADIDRYLASVDEPKRAALEELRRNVLAVLPEAEECISYGMPAFKVRGKTVAGFAAFRGHLSYLPHSGSVLAALEDDLAGYDHTKGSLHFPINETLPTPLVNKLIATRLAELGLET